MNINECTCHYGAALISMYTVKLSYSAHFRSMAVKKSSVVNGLKAFLAVLVETGGSIQDASVE